jgi:hypothetical protein
MKIIMFLNLKVNYNSLRIQIQDFINIFFRLILQRKHLLKLVMKTSINKLINKNSKIYWIKKENKSKKIFLMLKIINQKKFVS